MRRKKEAIHAGDPREFPAGILDRVMLRIEEERRRRMRVRIIGFGALSAAAIVALVLAAQGFFSEFSRSEFPQFFSLIFSDAGIITANFREFVYTLAETFPVFGASAILASAFALIFSLRFLIRDVRESLKKSRFAFK